MDTVLASATEAVATSSRRMRQNVIGDPPLLMVGQQGATDRPVIRTKLSREQEEQATSQSAQARGSNRSRRYRCRVGCAGESPLNAGCVSCRPEWPDRKRKRRN